MPLRKELGWAPGFVAGFAAGASGTVAVALLLYSGEGLLRSLTLIVAIEFGAFGVGLAVGGRPTAWNDAVESLRRRWLSVLAAFLAAAGFALTWVLFEGFGALPMTQALGLALLAGLPLYACGRLVKGIGAVRMMAGLTRDGALASFGAAAGVLVTGLGALSGVGVPSFVFFLLVILSGAALLQGWVLKPIEESIGPVEASAEFVESHPGSVESHPGSVESRAGSVESGVGPAESGVELVEEDSGPESLDAGEPETP